MTQVRDPFPMASAEAKAMEDSSSVTTGAWNLMSMGGGTVNTTTIAANEDDDDKDDAAVAETLLTSSTRNNDSNNIYADPLNEEEEEEDSFLDRPLWESKSNNKFVVYFVRSTEWLLSKLYGNNLPRSEMIRTLTLSVTLFFMIGGYWLLRSLKDPVLAALCGVQTIPKAKMLSVLVVLIIVSFYNHLLDSDIPKHYLFYIFGMFYFGLFTAIGLLLMHPTIGLPNQVPNEHRWLGWISYCGIESFGSVMVTLFWSFCNSNISLETAKSSYGVMVAFAQIGSILGPTLVQVYSPIVGPAGVYVMGAWCMLLLQGSMYMYIATYGVAPSNQPGDVVVAAAVASSKPKAGISEGLLLFVRHNYVKGIFSISCLFMVEVTIVDYTMKVLAQQQFAQEYPCQVGMTCYDATTFHHGSSQQATAAFASFMGFFGQATNVLSFVLSLLGTSAVIRYLGLRRTLLLFPTLCLAVILMVRLHPTLYTVFGAMMALKACSYALNNPTKEILYQNTAPNVKFKAKSWIDIFGDRGAKAVGSIVTNAFSDNADLLVSNGSLVGMGVATFLIYNAMYMGRKFDEYSASGYVVGKDEDDETDGSGIQLALAEQQNEYEDTSCALDDDDDDGNVGPKEEGQRVAKIEQV